MARSRTAFSRNLLLLLGVALQPAMMAVPVNAQAAGGGSSSPAHTDSSASSSVKAGSTAQGQGPIIVPKDFSELRIEPGDLLSVNVYDTPEFTNSYRVDPAGDLTIPLCGKVNVRGLTLPEAAKRLEAALKDGQILTDPQVNVDVQQYGGQYVTVLGEVFSPGRVALIAPTMLGEILAEAGGVTSLAGARIKIRHGSDDAAPEEEVPYSRSQSTRETAAILIRPGDSVIVPRAGIVYVLGAVNRPGGYVMQEDGKLNVAQALALSGGTVLQANTGGLRVIRRNPDGTVLDFPISYKSMMKGTQTPLLLQAQDIVYVPMSKVKATFTSAEGIIQAAASAAIVTQF
ncbi:MAG: polysaccharide biosynthesis/export family protein [Terracidiphilus sp.]|jgi:polysaccharide export outer membrane protein